MDSTTFTFGRAALATVIAATCFVLARQKHRSKLGWTLFGGLFTAALGGAGLGVVILLASRAKLDLQQRYLDLKAQERFMRMVGGPDLSEAISLDERILMILANNDEGLHLNAVAQSIGEDWRALSAPVNRLVQQGKVRVRGDLYFLDRA